MNPDQPAGPKESDIAEKAAEKRKPVFDPTGRVEHINETETKVADVRRHPFGLFLTYIQTFVGLGLALVMIFAFLKDGLKTLGLGAGAGSVVVLFGFISIVLGIVFLLLATRIYQGNQLIVTNINVTQVLQIGLFNRKVSELSMGNVEDVTAQQHGIFSTIFNYGTLRIETAGEQNNFVFVYCPNPNAYAKTILDAREQFMMTYGRHH
jgi:uncharacterized membrane protein YdbT with pleckstrin-like domain